MKVIGRIGVVITLLASFSFGSFGQTYVSNGKIVFERRVNLIKKFKDAKDQPWMNKDKFKKAKIETFELYFNDSSSLFIPKLSDVREEMDWATQKNKVYQNFSNNERLQFISFWSGDLVVNDSLKQRTWKLTTKKRKIAGYECRRAIWEVNDSLNIYAWYAEELILTSGPETFNGLPGMILGLATEDGGVVYFAKDVLIDNFDVVARIPKHKKKEEHTEEELKKILKKQFGQREDMDAYLEDLFMW